MDVLKRSLFCLAALAMSAMAYDFRLENSNFTLSQDDPLHMEDDRYLYNYNRLRLYGTFEHENFFFNLIADGVNYYGKSYVQSDYFNLLSKLEADTPLDLQSNMHDYDNGTLYGKIHRLYGGYEDDVQRLTLGLQKISMGVGRIWTPSDLYNPKNSYALEPDEVFGVLAANYQYAPSDLSQLSMVIAQRSDKSYKYALSFKAFLDAFDLGVNLIHSDDTTMYAYEIEGNFFETGAEWRSEGGWFESKVLETEFFQAIAGFDYAFVNGVTWTLEGYYSSETFEYLELIQNIENEIVSNMVQSPLYLATALDYSFALFLDASLLYIESFDTHQSRFIAPNLTYTLNDANSITLGAMLGFGSKKSEFGQTGDSFYVKWFFSY